MAKQPPTLLDDEDRGFARAALVEIVENQLRDNSPPVTRSTLTRLQSAGCSRNDAVHLIVCVLSAEIFEMLEVKRVFDAAHYANLLDALPDLPYDPDELTAGEA